jgi:hypothetical protein
MEALTAVAVAALTVYDKVKAVDKAMRIGGSSSSRRRRSRWERPRDAAARPPGLARCGSSTPSSRPAAQVRAPRGRRLARHRADCLITVATVGARTLVMAQPAGRRRDHARNPRTAGRSSR